MFLDSLTEINQCQYLELIDVKALSRYSAAVFTFEPYYSKPESETIQIGSTALEGTHAIVPVENSALYQLSFFTYAVYSIRPEKFTVWDKSAIAILSGKVSVLSESKYLNFAKTFISEAIYLGEEPLLHYQIGCLDHIIDIAAYGYPEFNKVLP